MEKKLLPEAVMLVSPKKKYPMSVKICGLSPLERNIRFLSRAGINEIYLDLSKEEMDFFTSNIANNLKKVTAKIVFGPQKNAELTLPSNIALQPFFFNKDELGRRFKEVGRGKQEMIPSDDFFSINTDEDALKAEAVHIGYIKAHTGGFIARNINKRVSIPISKRLASFRISPNFLTCCNMVVGYLSAVFMIKSFYSTPGCSYWWGVLGGLFFQLASVFDGVDGEVAKFTGRVSKFGSTLDTFSDNSTLLLFLAACSFLFYQKFGGLASLGVIGIMFVSLAIVIIAIVVYLKRYHESSSLAVYDYDFLKKLPQTDFLIRFTNFFKYLTKKEFFALGLFLFTFVGHNYLIVPMIALVLVCAAIVLPLINLKYFKYLPFED